MSSRNSFALVLLALAFGSVGCNEYTAEICAPALRSDVAGFAGRHLFIAQNGEDFSVEASPVELSRTAPGVYVAANGASVSTCAIGGQTVLESLNVQAMTYTAYLLSTTATGFVVSTTGFDAGELTAAGIPYRIVERPTAMLGLASLAAAAQATQRVIVVDNAKLANPSLIVRSLRPLSISLKLYR